MRDEDEPHLVTSGKSKRLSIDGFVFAIEIYRLEADTTWTLEVVDQDGTSHVWDDTFESDKEAFSVAVAEIERDGALTFMRGSNVIGFPQKN